MFDLFWFEQSHDVPTPGAEASPAESTSTSASSTSSSARRRTEQQPSVTNSKTNSKKNNGKKFKGEAWPMSLFIIPPPSLFCLVVLFHTQFIHSDRFLPFRPLLPVLFTATLTSPPLKPAIKGYKYQMRVASPGDINKNYERNIGNYTLTIGRMIKCIIIDILADWIVYLAHLTDTN